MRRGFKASCERIAADCRRTLGVPLDAALDAYGLAARLGVRVTTPEMIPTLSETSLRQLTEVDAASWSAVTLSHGKRRLVILNSAHSPVRQTSSLVHELAHLLLNHAADSARLSDEGLLFRNGYDKGQEEEADWLTGCLLVPRDGLLWAYRRTQAPEHLAALFGVSRRMIFWRLGSTGVPRQFRRFQAGSPTSAAVRGASGGVQRAG